jgi:SAM-dependent methyltransferase
MLLTLPCFMTQDSRKRAYIEKVRELEQRFGSGGEALAVGGEFEAVGKLEYYLLRSLGLGKGDLIVDVGCGSGRLAHQLAPYKDIRYIGTDVVPRLVEGAKALTMRDDWEFSVVADVHIPCADNVADFVAFCGRGDAFLLARSIRNCLFQRARCPLAP